MKSLKDIMLLNPRQFQLQQPKFTYQVTSGPRIYT